ncbi:primosomal protein N' [Marinibactrum halimedae]|uniref:Replication restart protein PriA n=1 Tax=Marinibactrum halimedae TaxID=1444977 RepID=A0AA37T044_9GAMM|nr:primosomal protein N' [Marinibactrum halimedae]MCD9459749.1 primosomal protein N' [Marinibactrum halimedae]GLS24494.1 primosomal protein N' [Marinibactrum halimedae]
MSKTVENTIVNVALAVPLRRVFDYEVPNGYSTPEVGTRISVPFGKGNTTQVGVVVGAKNESEWESIKKIDSILDTFSTLDNAIMALCRWAASYYQHALGEVLLGALPTQLRKALPAQLPALDFWEATDEAFGLPDNALKRAPKQAEALQNLKRAPLRIGTEKEHNITLTSLKALVQKGLATRISHMPERVETVAQPAPYELTDEQSIALYSIQRQLSADQTQANSSTVTLLEGATGSGKTEIYLQAIETALKNDQQALVLIPEIGLSPQTLHRFQSRFTATIVSLHSGLNDRQRSENWLLASKGIADIVIGTRSAIFTPMPRLGLIVIDEEHDLSFKQQEGFRYNARDLAIVRAQQASIPVVLGSATPSLETLNNAILGRYQHLRLKARPGKAHTPQIQILDIRNQTLTAGLCEPALKEIEHTLQAGHQALVFLNRRGYAPTLMCHSCGWVSQCPNCDARFTLHQSPSHLRCHHCDTQRPLPRACPECQSTKLTHTGSGTEKAEEVLTSLFPEHPVHRIDRDSTSRKGSLDALLDQIHTGEPCILVGTQMLAKGHHFPNVTLVVVLDADGGLFSGDFRGPERMGQMLLQVAGRAGREQYPGKVLIQSHHSDHPLLHQLLFQGYPAFAQTLLNDRRLTGMPPYEYLAILRAECTYPDIAEQWLDQARRSAQALMPPSNQLQYLGPIPAMMERVKGRYRLLIQIKATQRKVLQQLLSALIPELEKHSRHKSLRWSIDVDPLEIP